MRLWNDAHRTPELRIATASEFFRYMEEKYESKIPVVRGEFSGLWSEAKTSSPQISALARKAHDEIPAAETLWSALSIDRQIPFPVGDFYTLYQLLFKYDEHSGAGNVGWPGLNDKKMLDEQNREYAGFMRKAANTASNLLDSGIEIARSKSEDLAPRTASPIKTWPLTVWNSLSWERSEAVQIVAPQNGTHIAGIRDGRSHQIVPFDVDDHGHAIFLAQRVPPVGYVSYEIDAAPGTGAPTLVTSNGGLSAETGRFRISLHEDGSIASIRDLQQKRELVNSRGAEPFNHLLRSEGDQPSPVPLPFQPEIRIERGHVLTDLLITLTGSGFPLRASVFTTGWMELRFTMKSTPTRCRLRPRAWASIPISFAFPSALDPAHADRSARGAVRISQSPRRLSSRSPPRRGYIAARHCA